MAKLLSGKIVSTKMQKTVAVEVSRAYKHPLYKKIMKRNKKYLVDTNSIVLALGDIVQIQETRPLSKRKRFIVVKKI